MSVFAKLQSARVKLQATKLSKSGKNKFAGYEYFELGDFLPAIQQICNDVGLCGVVSFNDSMAYLTIHETEGAGQIVFTSPMSTAQLKGCHDVQNLGAVQTYLRRYLWTNAFELVEHDSLDATTGATESKPAAKPAEAPKPTPKPAQKPERIVGHDAPWQINAPGKPEGSVDEWLIQIEQVVDLALAAAKETEDVMQIFKHNKELFDAIKAADAVFFKDMMARFTETKKKLEAK